MKEKEAYREGHCVKSSNSGNVCSADADGRYSDDRYSDC